MAWLEGTAEREFEIDAPADRVAEFLSDPGQFEDCITDLDSLEQVDDGVWQFRLEELSAKGVSFQGEYRVAYQRDGHRVSWEPVEGDHNMKAEGSVDVEPLGGDRCRVAYEEKMSVELPIPKLMTKVFNPIVSREVSKGVGEMLDCAKETLEAESA